MPSLSNRLLACVRIIALGFSALGATAAETPVYGPVEPWVTPADIAALIKLDPAQAWRWSSRAKLALEDGRRAEGQRDIAAANRLLGGIEAYFARFGVAPPK